MRLAPPLLAATLGLVAASSLRAAEFQVDLAHSTFAVLTRKAGVAAGFAHDHLITAPKAAVKLSFDPADPAATRATLDVEVASLEIDPPGPRSRLKARLHELGIGPVDLPSIPASDRKKVREAALGKSQLVRSEERRVGKEC